VIQLTGADGVGSAGVYGTDWTLQLTSGSIVSQDAHHITLSPDAGGHIVFDSNHQVTFTDMERIDF
jgi:large repetitive protein